jgi:hypothetical protein
MKLLVKRKISDGLQWHLDNKKPLSECVYRPGSNSYYALVREARHLWECGELQIVNTDDIWLLQTNIGEVGNYNGTIVALDIPIEIKSVNEAEYNGKSVDLNKPMRSSGPKKYKVYVKNDNGNIIKVNFGDSKGGLSTKISNPEARKAFAARHNCEDKKDRTTAGYWSCNLPRYGKSLGITQGNFYW